jgi:transcription initiation factor TFIID subunit 5
MSAVVFGLLLGWLTDGGGPVAGAGAAEGLGKGTREMRGRTEMLRIINERCRLQGEDC